MGVWIERDDNSLIFPTDVVAPHAGAWIEIASVGDCRDWSLQVAPHAGAWIEIGIKNPDRKFEMLPFC